MGISPEGRPVSNVTLDNRHDVYKAEPWMRVMLFSEDEKRLLGTCWVPNTREKPDVIHHDGNVYTVIDSRPPARYRRCMELVAFSQQPEEPPNGFTLV